MNRTTVVAAALLSTAVLFACDKPADDQAKINAAQAEADEKIAAAKRDADQKSRDAQATADKKIAEANASFAKTREDYRHKMAVDTADLDKTVADLEAKAKKATGKAKTDLEASLAQIRARRTTFDNDAKSLDTATALTWDSTKARLDKEWSELKSMVDKA